MPMDEFEKQQLGYIIEKTEELREGLEKVYEGMGKAHDAVNDIKTFLTKLYER